MARKGILVWQGAVIDWRYETFKSQNDFTIQPHFVLKATNPKNDEWVEWDNIEISSDDSSIKGITDFTKLPKKLMIGILDNACAKLYETPPTLH